MADQGLKIGELAKRCGVSRDTLRFYEREGLLPPPRRTSSRHRVYEQEFLDRLLFIRRAQELGLTLSDIRDLFRARALPSAERCRIVAARLRDRMKEHDRKIAALRAERRRLSRSLQRCENSRPQECPVLASLLAGEEPARRRRRA